MAQSVTTMLKDGQEYMKTWPLRKELYALFPDCRVVAATRFAIKVMPPLAVLSWAAPGREATQKQCAYGSSADLGFEAPR